MNRTIQGLVWGSLLLIATQTWGQEVTVVVRDAKSGHAVPNAVVWVQFYEAPANRVLQRIQYKTGPDGMVRVPLATPPPIQLTVSASVDSFYGASLTVATADLFQHGAVGRCGPKPGDTQPTPELGRMIFLVCRIPWWVRLIAPLERG